MREIDTNSQGRWRRSTAAATAVFLALALNSCGDRQAEALGKLAAAGYQLSLPDFFRAAAAGDARVIELFLQAGTAVDVPRENGETALVAAARAGAVDAAKVLLAHGASVNAKAQSGEGLLLLAAASGNVDLVRALIAAGADVRARDAGGAGALQIAARAARSAVVEALLPSCPEQRDEALLEAAACGDVSTLDVLLQSGASVFTRQGGSGATPLLLASGNGHADAVTLLLRSGADRFALDDSGRGGVDLAAASHHTEVAELLWSDLADEERELGAVEFVQTPRVKSPVITGTLMEVPAAIPVSSVQATWSGAGLLNGAVIEGNALGGDESKAVTDRLALRGFRRAQLPFLLREVRGHEAVFENFKGEPAEIVVAAGAEIASTGWLVEKIVTQSPSGLQPPGWWLPQAVVKRADGTGRWLALVDMPIRAGTVCAVLEVIGTRRTYEGTPEDHFQISESGAYRSFVVDRFAPGALVLKRDDGSGAEVLLRSTRF